MINDHKIMIATTTTTTTTTTTIITGGLPASTRTGTPNGMVSQRGQCRIFSECFPALGLPTPSSPALFREATTYAWRNRLRKIPTGKSERNRGEVLRGGPGHSGATLAT